MRSNLLMSFLCVFLTGISPSLAEVPEEPEFEPSGQLWGYVFGDFFYKVLGNDDWGNTQYAQVHLDAHPKPHNFERAEIV